jgi:hypothetical protein
MSKPSLLRQVTAMIAERGPSTLDDIAPLFPDIERKTVQKAIGNARAMGLLHSEPAPPGKFGYSLATYVVTDKANDAPTRKLPTFTEERPPTRGGAFWQQRIASVFDLGRHLEQGG